MRATEKRKKIMTEEEIKEKVMAEDKSQRSNTESMTEESEDRISELPDCLLVHILSFLYPDEAARTCLLSKRWQFIWTGILKVDFSKFRSIYEPHQSWDWVGKMLAMCKNLKEINVILRYGDFLHPDLDHWIQLAIKNKVRNITLDLIPSAESNEEIYMVPEELYSYSSLTKLRLENCLVAPRGIITWGSLIKLRVEEVDWMYNLNLYCPNLTTLEISGYKHHMPNISAPLLRILLIDAYNEEFSNEESDEEFDEKSPRLSLYSYSSLTKLTLRRYVLSRQRIIKWGCLKSLIVEEMKLSDSLMEKILSSCPVLEFLLLEECSGLKNLNIYSQNLTTLEILSPEDNPILNISAPHLRILSIHQGCKEDFMLKNLSSIVEVTLGTTFNYSTRSKITLMNHMKQILPCLQSAKTINLTNLGYLMVFSSLEVEGWKFPLFIQLQCLKLEALTHEMSIIPGIIALLRSSPNLEALEIGMCNGKQYISLVEDGVSLYNYDTDLVASHLKTVKIEFYEQDLDNELLESLVSILLKSAEILEEMTIKVKGSQHVLNKIVERLLTIPKASSKAVIVLCS